MRLSLCVLVISILCLLSSCGGNSGSSNIFENLSVVKSTSLAASLRYVGGAQTFDAAVFDSIGVTTVDFTLTDSLGSPIAVTSPIQSGSTYSVSFTLPVNQNMAGQADAYTMRVQVFDAAGAILYDNGTVITVPAMTLPPNPPSIP